MNGPPSSALSSTSSYPRQGDFWSLSGRGYRQYSQQSSCHGTRRKGQHSNISVPEQGHTSCERIDCPTNHLAIAAVSRTFNPLVAGSNPARPTTNLVVSDQGVTSNRDAFFCVCSILSFPLCHYARLAPSARSDVCRNGSRNALIPVNFSITTSGYRVR